MSPRGNAQSDGIAGPISIGGNRQNTGERSMNNIDLAGRTAIVTGGATGIGRAIACAFGARGWRVAIGARRSERLDDAVAGSHPSRAALARDRGSASTGSASATTTEVLARMRGVTKIYRRGGEDLVVLDGLEVDDRVRCGIDVVVDGHAADLRDLDDPRRRRRVAEAVGAERHTAPEKLRVPLPGRHDRDVWPRRGVLDCQRHSTRLAPGRHGQEVFRHPRELSRQRG